MIVTATMRRALVAGTASLLVVLAAGCGSNGMDHGGMSPATGTPATSGAAYNDTDVMFAQMMIPHHQQAVEMSTLAETRAQDTEVKQLAAAIKGAQQPEIDTMTGWLTSWGKPMTTSTDLPGMGHGGHGGVSGMMTDEEMNQLAAARGTDFDRRFAQMMIAHHNGAIQMAQDEVQNGSNRAVIDLAKAIVKTQMAEVVTLQKVVDRL